MNTKRRYVSMLSKYIKLRGLSQRQIAASIGFGEALVGNVVSQRPVATREGQWVNKNPEVRKKIAVYLDLDYDCVWGPRSSFFLGTECRKLVAAKIKKEWSELLIKKESMLKAVNF